MSYAVKYILSFISERKNDYKIEILQEGYSGAVFVKSLGVPPILSIEDGDGAIKGTSLSFSIQSDLEGELKELYTEDNKQFKVLLYRNRELYWQGYLLPELYSENYIDAPYDVAVTATDQLATLKNIVYDQAGADRTLSEIISFILQKTQINLAVKQHLSINISDGKTLLDGAYINSATFFGQSCYDVLNAILQSCNACIQQYNGEWIISSLTDKSAEYIIAGVEEVIQHRVIGQLGEQEVYPEGSLEMVCNPALRGVNLEYAHVLKNSFLKNADCTSRDGWMWSMIEGDDTRFPGIIDNLGEVYQCNFWALPQYDLSSTGLQIWQDVEIVADGSRTCELSVNYKMGVRTEHLLLAIIHEGNDGIRRRLTSSGWIEGSNAAEIQNYIVITGSVSNYWLNYWDLIDSSTFETAKVSFNLPAVAGTLRIGFINAAKPGTTPYLGQAPIYLTRVYLNYLGVNGKAANAIVAPSATGAQQDIILSYGDAAQLANDKLAVVNTLRDVTGNVLTDYRLKSLSVDKTFSSYFLLMLQEYSRYFGKKKMQLQGSLMGGDALALMYIDSYSGAILRLRSAQYDLFNEVVNVLLEEVTDDFVEYDTQVIATDNKIASTTTSSSVPTVGGGNTEGSSGEVTIMLGNVAYSSVNGVVVLPAYPDVGLNEEELTEFLAANKYATQSWVKGITDDLETDIADRVLVTDFEKVEDAVDGIAGYFTNGSANNALKLGGQLPSYYATKSALDTTNGNVVSLTQRMGTAESGISTNKTNIATLTTDLSKLTSRVSTAEGTIKEHTDTIALNANNIASNAKSITTNATAITAVSNRVQKFEDVIGIDSNGDVYIKGTRNFYTEGGTIGMAGLGSGGGGGTAGLGSVTVRVNGQDYITDASGIVTLPNYPSLAGYATEQWVADRGYITGITSAMVTSALGYTPYNSASFTKANIKSTLGIADWALAASKPSYSWSEITGKPTFATVATSGKYSDLSGVPNSLPASDVYSWAKATTKPTYTFSEITGKPTTLAGYGITDALSVNGGTIGNGISGVALTIDRASTNPTTIKFNSNGSLLGYIGFDTSKNPIVNVNSAIYTLYHTGNFNPADYLPKSGGTISNNTAPTPLVVNSNTSVTAMRLTCNSANKTELGWDGSTGTYLFNYASSSYLSIKDDGTPIYNGNTLYHTGNFNPADYLPLSGGTLTNSLAVSEGTISSTRTSTRRAVFYKNASDTVDYGTYIIDVSDSGDAILRLTYNNLTWKDNAVIHSGNYADYAYPKDGRGYMSIGSNGRPIMVNNQGYGAKNTAGTTEEILWLDNNNITYVGGTTSKKVFLYDNSPSCLGGTVIHSGNIGSQSVDFSNYSGYISEYNLGAYLSTKTASISGWYDWGNNTGESFETFTHGLRITSLDSNYYVYLGFSAYGGEPKVRYIQGGLGEWNTIALTTSNVASASKLQTARTIWGQSFDGSGDISAAPSFPAYIDVNRNADTGVLLDSSRIGFEIETYANDVKLKTYTPSGSNSAHLVLTYGGNVLIGTTTDNGYKLQVDGGIKLKHVTIDEFNNIYSDNGLWIQPYGGGEVNINYLGTKTVINQGGGNVLIGATTDNGAKLQVAGNLTATGDITSEGTMAMGRLASSSDAKLKENIKWLSADKSMEVVRALRPTEWDWKKDGTHSFGFIAQEVEPIVPEMVSSVNDTLRLEYNQLHAFEIGAIKHIDSEVEILKRDLKNANNRIESLENELKQYRRNA